MLHITPSRHISHQTDTYLVLFGFLGLLALHVSVCHDTSLSFRICNQPTIYVSGFPSFFPDTYLSFLIHVCHFRYVSCFCFFLQTYIGQPCLLSVISFTCLTNQIYITSFLFMTRYMSVVSYIYRYFLFIFKTYIGQTRLMSVIPFTWLTIRIYIASFLFIFVFCLSQVWQGGYISSLRDLYPAF